jgi:hypothetical protein
MKRIAAIALLVAASFVTAGSAMAQDHAVMATIPFNFAVDGRLLPAGNYTLGPDDTSPRILWITNRETGVRILTVEMPNWSEQKQPNVLVFHKIGNQYFLSEIHSKASSMDVRLSTSKQEKRARAETQQAGLRFDDDVIVALY